MAIYRQAVNSVYIVGRLSTHRSVHYRRFLGLPRYTFNCPACATYTVACREGLGKRLGGSTV